MQLATARNSAEEILHQAVDDTHKAWQAQIWSLQQYICELLIKNQQLRMALTEINAREPGRGHGCDA